MRSLVVKYCTTSMHTCPGCSLVLNENIFGRNQSCVTLETVISGWSSVEAACNVLVKWKHMRLYLDNNWVDGLLVFNAIPKMWVIVVVLRNHFLCLETLVNVCHINIQNLSYAVLAVH